MAKFYRLQTKEEAHKKKETRASETASLSEVNIEAAFPFLSDGGNHIISIVGAGGKTSTMRLLAEEFTRRGRHTIETTTTHIANPGRPYYVHPEADPGSQYFVQPGINSGSPNNLPPDSETKGRTDPDGTNEMACRLLAQLSRNWNQGLFATVGTVVASNSGNPQGKLAALPDNLLEAVLDIANVTLIEADGARRLPMKVPAAHEPVIHARTDTVLAVLGMHALGQNLEDVCCRVDEAEELLGKTRGELVTEEDFVTIFASEAGVRKGVGERVYIPVINQCDDEERKKSAARILRALWERGFTNALASQLRSPTVDQLK